MTDWISVKDRLPEDDKDVVTYGIYGHLIGHYNPKFKMWFIPIYDCGDTIEYWMPLTEPHEVNANDN